MNSADAVYTQMSDHGLKEFALTRFDFHFISNKRENLDSLSEYLSAHYPYTLKEIEKLKGNWELSGETNEMPVTEDILLYWVLDMNKKGYRFDCKLDGYGGLVDDKEPRFPDFDSTREDFYFDRAIECYDKEDLSGAIINWTLTLKINPKDPNSYYSRAIAKSELFTWKMALQDYDRAIEIAPDFTSAITNRGALKDDNGDYKGAIADYDLVLSLENIDEDHQKIAYFNRGNSKLTLGDKEGACKDWKTALKLGADYAIDRLNQYCD